MYDASSDVGAAANQAYTDGAMIVELPFGTEERLGTTIDLPRLADFGGRHRGYLNPRLDAQDLSSGWVIDRAGALEGTISGFSITNGGASATPQGGIRFGGGTGSIHDVRFGFESQFGGPLIKHDSSVASGNFGVEITNIKDNKTVVPAGTPKFDLDGVQIHMSNITASNAPENAAIIDARDVLQFTIRDCEFDGEGQSGANCFIDMQGVCQIDGFYGEQLEATDGTANNAPAIIARACRGGIIRGSAKFVDCLVQIPSGLGLATDAVLDVHLTNPDHRSEMNAVVDAGDTSTGEIRLKGATASDVRNDANSIVTIV